MDFAPRKEAKATSAKRAVSGASGGTRAKKPAAARQAAKTTTAKPAARKTAVRSTGAGTFSSEKKPKLGAIEDLNQKFVKRDVPKRPLGADKGHFRTSKTGVAAVKAQKVGVRGSGVRKVAAATTAVSTKTGAKPVEKPVENSQKLGSVGTYQAPKTPFINQDRVPKRPLSKNVYAKKIEIPKEVAEAQGPVTIISQPEKQAHTGMIVTIILTIILGAAAGTVAFLLLPK